MKSLLINQKKFAVTPPDSALPFKIKKTGAAEFELLDGQNRRRGYAQRDKGGLWIFLEGHVYHLAAVKEKLADAGGAGAESAFAGDAILTSPMPAKVYKLLVKEGDAVKKDQELIILEAMKMEHSLSAPKDGVVAACKIQEGDMVDLGATLAIIE